MTPLAASPEATCSARAATASSAGPGRGCRGRRRRRRRPARPAPSGRRAGAAGGQPAGELGGRLRAARGVRRQRRAEQVLQAGGQVVARQPRDLAAQDPGDQRRQPDRGLAGVGGPAGEHRVQRGGQRVDVGGDGGVGALEDLRGAVHHRERGGLRHRVALGGDPGDAEVGQRGLPVGGDEHVLRLDVAVQDPGAVRGLQRARQLAAGVEHLGDGHRAVALDPVGERAAGAELHRQPRPVARGRAGVVDGDDVRVRADPAGGHALGAEPAQDALVEAVEGEDLQRHGAVEPLVVGAVHDREAAAGELLDVGVAVRDVRPAALAGTLRRPAEDHPPRPPRRPEPAPARLPACPGGPVWHAR